MATGAENDFLFQSAIYLGATAITVPVFRRLRLGSILGFLAAGVLLGPSGFGLLAAEEDVFHVAELGVVLFLFVIGLELSFPKLWSLRNTIFGLGLLQMVVTGLAIGAGFYYSGLLPIGAAMVVGFALGCSSTAMVLSLLEERRELPTRYGQKAFSILLFQDLAVIPLLAAVPLLASFRSNEGGDLVIDWQAIAFAAAAVIGLVTIGKVILDRFFRLVAISGSREGFTAATLFVVAGVALLFGSAGLSLALGAFLAGVLLAESAFRHQIEADIEPFRELLLGLFFIGVGMQLDIEVVIERWWVVLSGAFALIAFKALVIYILARFFRGTHGTALKTAAILSQGGEFAFVVFSLASKNGILESELTTILSAVVTISMVATPVLIEVAMVLGRDRSKGDVEHVEDAETRGRVIIVGFGRMGQLVTALMTSSGVDVVTIDSDPRRIELASRFGHKVYFGDGTDMHLLMTAGARNVDAVIFTSGARDRLKNVVEGLRELVPNVRILARVYDRMHEIEVMDSGADHLQRETFESSLSLAGKALSFLNFSDALVADIIAEYRERDRERLLAQKAEGIYAKKDMILKPFDALTRDET